MMDFRTDSFVILLCNCIMISDRFLKLSFHNETLLNLILNIDKDKKIFRTILKAAVKI